MLDRFLNPSYSVNSGYCDDLLIFYEISSILRRTFVFLRRTYDVRFYVRRQTIGSYCFLLE